MSRWEFMRRLEELLSDISPNEREEALQYYNDYFNDAGRENEASVIEALGSPEQVANIVKEGLSDPEEQGEFTETGFCDAAAEERRNQVAKRTIPVAEDSGGIHQEQEKPEAQFEKKRGEDKKGLPTWAIVLIVVGCFFVSPVILGAVCGIAGALLGLVAAVMAVVFAFGLTALILFVVGVSLFVAGMGCLIYSPIDAIGLIGGACICLAIGILAMVVTIWFVGRGIPAIWRGGSWLFHQIFRKKGEVL